MNIDLIKDIKLKSIKIKQNGNLIEEFENIEGKFVKKGSEE